MPLSQRARAILFVCVLAVAVAGAAALVLGRSNASTDASPPPPSPPTAAPKSPHSAPASVTKALPVAIQGALSANRVVVVALFDPSAKVDGVSVGEASAGAQLAGAAFVSVDVTTADVDSLQARYGVIEDPAVLVLRPPAADLAVRIDGFADRDTVAQAAVNAAS